MKARLTLPLLCALSATPAHAMLLDAWSKALSHDPDYQAAIAEQDATQEDLNLARSQLLPQVNAQGSRGKADAKITGTGPGGKTVNRQYNANLWTLQIRQPLFRPASVYAYQSSAKHVAASDELRQDARQTLLANLVETLGRLHFANASLDAARVAASSASQMLNLSQRQLRAGNATRRDIADAQTALAQARQQIADAKLEQATQEATWQQLTGDTAADLQPLPFDLAERLPVPESDVSLLLADARARQPALRAAQQERDSAQLDIKRARSEYLPNLDLTASRSFNESNTENTIDTTFLTNRIDLQLTLPLFNGGATQARIRQGEALLRQADAKLNGSVTRTQTRIVRALAGLSLARQQAASSRAAAESADINLRSAVLGITAGTATLADKLNAEAAKAIAERDQTRANIEALISWSQLQQALGQLDEDSLRTLMALLGWKEPARQAVSFGR